MSELVTCITCQGFNFKSFFLSFRNEVDLCFKIRCVLFKFSQPEARSSLNEQANGTIRCPKETVNHGDSTNLEEILWLRNLQLRIARGYQADQAVFSCDNIIHQTKRSSLSNCQWYRSLRVDEP